MKAERRSAAAWGMVFGYATIALSVIRNVALVPVYLRFVTTEEYGAWLATGGTLVQLLISDYGVGGVILQRTAATFGANDKSRLGNVIGTALISSAVLAAILSVISLALAPWIAGMLGLDPSISRRVTECFLLAVLANAISVVATIGNSVLRGLQRAIVSGGIQLASEVVLIGVTVVLLYAGYGLYAMALGMIARAVVAAVASGIQAFVVCVRRFDLRLHFDRVEGTKLLADSTSLFVVSLSIKALTRSDVFLVGMVMGPQSAAVYGLTTRIIDTVTMFLTQINASLAPSMAHLFGEGNLPRFRELLARMLPVLGGLTLIGLCAATAINGDFISLWVGRKLYGGDQLSMLFALASYVSAVGYIGYDALMATGQFRFIAAVFIAFALVYVGLAFVLLRFGMAGAPIAAIITSVCWAALFWRRVIDTLDVNSTDTSKVVAGLASSFAAAVMALAVGSAGIGHVVSWSGLALKGAVIVAATSLAVLASSRWIRSTVQEEFAATIRSFRR